jgi:hypothetical protein
LSKELSVHLLQQTMTIRAATRIGRPTRWQYTAEEYPYYVARKWCVKELQDFISYQKDDGKPAVSDRDPH